MSAIATSPRASLRPATITWATIGNVVFNILGLAGFALPGSDDIPVFAIVIGLVVTAIAVALSWFIWNGKKWAAITLTVIAVLNVLTSLPGLFDPPSAAIVAFIVVGIPFTAALCWLLWHPDSRRFYRAA